VHCWNQPARTARLLLQHTLSLGGLPLPLLIPSNTCAISAKHALLEAAERASQRRTSYALQR
jgi:antitoxin component of RelBE/YafQ-DinJ toxin-antitoxin module